MDINRKANNLVNELISLAFDLDPGYSDICADTTLTGPLPENKTERIVWELHRLSLMINASGLCDSSDPYIHTFKDYGVQREWHIECLACSARYNYDDQVKIIYSPGMDWEDSSSYCPNCGSPNESSSEYRMVDGKFPRKDWPNA